MTLSADFWPSERKTLLSILLPRLEHAAFVAMQHAALKMGISFNPTLANKDAEAWAAEYTDTVLQQLGTTTEDGVGGILSTWIDTPGATYGDLVQSLMDTGLFDQVRAARIAVTETTRAYGQGEAMAYDRELGLSAAVLPVEDTHPNCYCWLSVKRLGNENVIVWQSNKDDRTCTQLFDMPWGTVEGCQELDGLIVSEGDYLGQRYDDLEKMAKVSADAYSQPPYIRPICKLGAWAVWIVDGAYIRNNIFIDFTAGGNPERFGFIPAGEIWIDKDNEAELAFIQLHEMVEARLMADGMSYEKAHEAANVKESEARDNPDKLPGMIAEEGLTA
jgi:hypothetical protein